MSRKLGSFQNVQYWFHLGHGFGRKLMPKRFSWLKFFFSIFYFCFCFIQFSFSQLCSVDSWHRKSYWFNQSQVGNWNKLNKQTDRQTDKRWHEQYLWSNVFFALFHSILNGFTEYWTFAIYFRSDKLGQNSK
jgi:hypothetical protein